MAGILPPLSSLFDARRDYYRLAFTPDGMPGRQQDDGTVDAHPMYGVYVLKDYLLQHEQTPSADLEDALRTVVNAVLRRSERLHDARVWWYDPEPTQAARLHTRHYSGLTQAYYAVVLRRVAHVLSDTSIRRAAAEVAASLLIPARDGGVLFRDEHGLSFAEVPDEPNPYILNGWLSILVWMHKYAAEADDQRFLDVAKQSTRTLEGLLPRYDVPDLANSRYGLTGFQYARLRAGPGELLEIASVSLRRAGAGPVPVHPKRASRWQDHVLLDDVDEEPGGRMHARARTVRLNLVVSHASPGRQHELLVDLHEPASAPVALDLHVGSYDPLATGPTRGQWVEAAVHAPGARLRFTLPPGLTDLVAYPTSFKKRIGDAQVNVYHPLHVFRLRELAARVDSATCAAYAQRWAEYVCRWSTMERYEGLHVTRPERTGHGPPTLWCDVGREGRR